MKNIQSINVWKNGTIIAATKLQVNIVFDNLQNTATFFYQLLEVVNAEFFPIAEGNVYMGSTDYTSWDRSIDDAYSYVAGELNLTIVP
jgi:hypothetical protein